MRSSCTTLIIRWQHESAFPAVSHGMGKGLGFDFGRGALWLGVSSAAARAFGVAAQLVLGASLSDADFGVFALAMGLTSLTMCLRGGNVVGYLQTLDHERFLREAGGFIRLSGLACLIGLVATLLAALWAPVFVPTPGVRGVLVAFAVTSCVPFFSMPSRACLAARLAFGRLAVVDCVSAFVRAGLAIALAVQGMGAYALVIPIVVSGLVEALLLNHLMPVPVLRLAVAANNTKAAAHTVRWTVLAAVASTMIYQGDYLGASYFVSTDVLGQYFFAYSLCNQIGYLSTSMLGGIVAPVIARMDDDQQRQEAAGRRLAAGLALVMPGILMTLPVAFPEIDRLVWGGRWEGVRWPMVLIAPHLACLLTTTLLYGALHGRGHFRLPALLDCIRAVALLSGAALGGALFHTAGGIALGALLLGGTASVFASVAVNHALGSSCGAALKLLGGGPCLAFAVAVLIRSGVDTIQGWSGATPAQDPRWFIEAVATAAVFLVGYGMACRLVFPDSTRDLMRFVRYTGFSLLRTIRPPGASHR